MRPSAHPARRAAAIIGLIGAMLLTGGADRAAPNSRAAERATAAAGEVRDDAAPAGRDEASGRDEALKAVGDHLDDLGDPATHAVDDTVDHTTDTVRDTVTNTGETVDDVVDETTDAVDGLTDERLDGTTDTVDETVDHTTDTVDDAVGHTTDTVDGLVDGTTDTLDSVTDRVRGDEQNAGGSPPVEEQPPPADGGPNPADEEPPSPVDPDLPTAAAPSEETPESAPPGEEDTEPNDGANDAAPSDPDDPGSLFNGSGGIGERAPFPLALMLILAGFLGVQAWVDRRDPKLATAPLETEPDLVFERP